MLGILQCGEQLGRSRLELLFLPASFLELFFRFGSLAVDEISSLGGPFDDRIELEQSLFQSMLLITKFVPQDLGVLMIRFILLHGILKCCSLIGE